jgi:hypothetical protein
MINNSLRADVSAERSDSDPSHLQARGARGSLEPVIVIGMHRSGTTMITHLLERLGLFMGWLLQENSEALFFVRRNEKLMQVCGGSWEGPVGVERLMENGGMRRFLAEQLLRDMSSVDFLSYLGPRRYLACRKVQNINFPWGWKDPRNSFLLPVWLDIFPRARVIHIFRNGIDVACSLQQRDKNAVEARLRRLSGGGLGERGRRRVRQLEDESPLLYLFRRIGSLQSRLAPLSFYNRFAVSSAGDLNTGFDLWRAYVAKCFKLTESISNESLTLKYEDFLAEPEKNLAALANFCGLQADEGAIRSLCAGIRIERRFAFKTNQEAARLYERVRHDEWMARLGYSDL